MLAEKGHTVVNFSLKNEKKEFIENNIEIVIPKRRGYLSNYYEIYKIIKRTKPDVVLSNFSYVNPALLFGKLFGVKKNMVWFHSLNEQMESTKMNIFIKKQFLKLADIIVANSYLTKNELNTIYNVPEFKLKTLPFWTNISEHTHNETKPDNLKSTVGLKIGCPGRMAEHKNQKVVIQALAQIKQNHDYKFHVYFAGDGVERINLENLTKDLNLTDVVSFLKHVSANDMIRFYKDMDVIVLPSLHEAFGLVFIEALAMSTPVLVSSQFGALSFIDDKKYDLSKLMFNPESVEDLQAKLMTYFNNKGLTKKELKKVFVNNFDKDSIFKDFLKIVQ
jgi:glycosyltransferase involved in cell wall biosynthesis